MNQIRQNKEIIEPIISDLCSKLNNQEFNKELIQIGIDGSNIDDCKYLESMDKSNRKYQVIYFFNN